MGSINAVRIDGGLANRVAIAVATGIIDIGTIQALASGEIVFSEILEMHSISRKLYLSKISRFISATSIYINIQFIVYIVRQSDLKILKQTSNHDTIYRMSQAYSF